MTPSSESSPSSPAGPPLGETATTSGAIQITPVQSRRRLNEFIDLPYALYRRDLQWVPPLRIVERERLDPGRNPFFEYADVQLFLATRNGAVEGRIAAIDDRRHNEVHQENTAGFGFFEAANGEAAAALLAEVELWARARGRSFVRGPVSPSQNDMCGLLIDGFDTPPFVMMTHNPPEYAAFIEQAGYVKAKDLYAWVWDFAKEAPERVFRLADRFSRRHGIAVRPLDLRRFAKQLPEFHEIYCKGWANNWGFVPPTDKEFAHIAAALKLIADPEFVLCAEVADRAVGFAVLLPDVNQALRGTNGRLNPHTVYRLLRRRAYIDQLRVLLLGVLPEYRRLGLFPLLIAELVRRGARSRYRRMEGSWVLEDNHDINIPAEQGGAIRHKTYRIYGKSL
jgi:GNAT superfamily N-acetyltransferase